MPSFQDLRRRIKSIKSTQQITKAMKAVSAAKMRRAQDAVLAARPYSKRIKGVLGRVATAATQVKHPLLEVRETKKVAYLVITADRGLCGGFNSNVIRRAAQDIKGKSGVEISIVAVGRKARDFFKRREFHVAKDWIKLPDNAGNTSARTIAEYVVEKYSAEEFDVVYLVYSQFVNVMVQKPLVIKLLPVEPPAEEEDSQKVDYIFEPSAEEVLTELLPKYVENAIYQGILETKAGEHSARMAAMDNATKNASDMISRLTLTMNRARQAQITKEISEIVSGAAALE